MKNLKELQNLHLHFVGIGGISMSGLAQIAINNGAIVTGSDLSLGQEIDKLRSLGASVCLGHKPENLPPDTNLLVYTSAVKDDNPELVHAKALGISIMERAEFLGLVARCYNKVIAVAGTHGKTTTTAIISEIFTHAGLNPTIHLGGESIGLKGNTILGDDQYFVVEACEYKESFRYLNPYIGIITNIESDHLDYYKDYDDIRLAFERFADRSNKLISLERDNMVHIENQTIYGDWRAKQIEFVGNGYNFNVYYKNKFFHTFRINVLGEHNITNSLFAIATAHECGISRDVMELALANFVGVERRYETIKVFPEGCRLIIDYAHHPTELKASIDGIKDVFKRVLYVFQPHTYSRTKCLFAEFVEVLGDLYNLVVFETYPAREKVIAGGTAKDLYSALSSKSSAGNFQQKYFDNVEKLMEFLKAHADNFDCILVMGAGDLAEKLKRNYVNA